jgi:hypothetical protein
MAFKVKDLMVDVLPGKGMVAADPSTCVTRTISSSFDCCADVSSAWLSPLGKRGDLAVLRQQLRATVARA